MTIATILDQIIKTGDRVELKKFLSHATDKELSSNWVKLACCKIQDFNELTMNEMRKRGMI
jgi:hypothetical protein